MERLLIALLLLFPWEICPEKASTEMWDALRETALECEVVGPHETWGQFDTEISYVKRHLRNTINAPPIIDGERFSDLAPPMLKFNAAYQSYCSFNYQTATDQEEWYKISQETEKLSHIWELVNTAGEKNGSWAHRRAAMQKLRAALGDENYYSGNLPPAVPIWRYTEID